MQFEFNDYRLMLEELDQSLLQSLAFSADCPSVLKQSMQYSLSAGGKRLRPLLVFLAAEYCDCIWTTAMPAAVAIEMIHTYSLIHDDLPAMDDDDLRRGKPTNHIVYGEANAILAGDALLTHAFEVVAKADLPSETIVQLIRVLSSAAGAEGMVGGQVVDLIAEKEPIADLEQLKQIHMRKTGRLISVSLEMGGIVAQADSQTLTALKTYGMNIGLAFQVIDDILDCTSSREILGKGVQKDQSRGKATFPSLLGLEESREYAHNLVHEACDQLNISSKRAGKLVSLAHYVVSRDR
jgi:geranylgeranyl diphosphate synthase, type II